MTEASTELLPCPWCGTAEHLTLSTCGSMTADMPSRPHKVLCTHIDHDTVEGPVAYGRLAAVEAWNTRAKPTPVSGTDAVEVTKARQLLETLSGWSDSEFALVAMGDDGEELKGRIEGSLANLIQSLSRTEELVEALDVVRAKAGLARLFHGSEDATDRALADIIQFINAALASHRGEGL